MSDDIRLKLITGLKNKTKHIIEVELVCELTSLSGKKKLLAVRV